MKKTLLVSLIVVSLSILIAGFAIPAFAHGPGDANTVPIEKEAWEAMWEACGDGDWEAMAEAAEEVHGGTPGYMFGPADNPEDLNEGMMYPRIGWDAMDEIMDDAHEDIDSNIMPAPGTGWDFMGGHMSGGTGMSMWYR